MDLKALLLGLLSATYQMDETAVAALFEADGTTLKSDALQTLLDKDKSRVADLKKDRGFDDGHKKGKSEALSTFEKEIKEKHGLTSEKKGLELIAELLTAKAPSGDTLTDEQVKKSRAYIDLNESINQKVADAKKEVQQAFDAYKNGIETKEVVSGARAEALKIFDSLNPVLSNDPAKAAAQKELFLKTIEANSFRKEGDNYILLNPDGTDKTDAHSNRIKFDAYVKETAGNYFDFKQTDPKASPSNGGAGGGQGNQGKKFVVKTKDDFAKQYAAATTHEDRTAIANAWEEAQKAAN